MHDDIRLFRLYTGTTNQPGTPHGYMFPDTMETDCICILCITMQGQY